jgi:hypothetical protein
MQAAKSEYSEVRELVDSAGPYFYRYPKASVTCGCPGGYVKKAPTPAELIVRLKEHEWVRGTYSIGSKEYVFGPATTYKAGLLLYAGQTLLRGEISGVNNQVVTIERCDPPEVK